MDQNGPGSRTFATGLPACSDAGDQLWKTMDGIGVGRAECHVRFGGNETPSRTAALRIALLGFVRYGIISVSQ